MKQITKQNYETCFALIQNEAKKFMQNKAKQNKAKQEKLRNKTTKHGHMFALIPNEAK